VVIGAAVDKGGCAMVVEKLQHHELFGLLTPKEVERLSDVSAVMKLRKGERVYAEGIPASHFFVLLNGRVELRRPAEGGLSFLVDNVVEGGVFGVSSLTAGERYLLNAECVEDSEVLKVESQILRCILDENPAIGYAVQRRISQIFFKRYVEAMERLRSILLTIPMGPTEQKLPPRPGGDWLTD
jgi:CRP-like cAMP-binding protein